MMLLGTTVFVVPRLQVVEGDGIDGGVLGLAGVGIVWAVGELDGFADRDAVGIVVAPRDRGLRLPFASWSLSALKVGWSNRSRSPRRRRYRSRP